MQESYYLNKRATLLSLQEIDKMKKEDKVETAPEPKVESKAATKKESLLTAEEKDLLGRLVTELRTQYSKSNNVPQRKLFQDSLVVLQKILK